MPLKIMVVDDEPDLAKLVAHHLSREGFEPVVAASGTEALKRIGKIELSLVILDLMMPGEDGLQICKRIRSQPETASLPIIIVTAKDQESDKIVGLELGADDYMTKPFSPKELMARVKAILRRRERIEKKTVYLYEALVLDLTRHEVKVAGEKIALTAKEFALLEHLLKNKERVFTRDHLLNEVWGIDFFGTSRTVDVHIRRLREKIPLLARAIETIPSIGYKLVDETSLRPSPADSL